MNSFKQLLAEVVAIAVTRLFSQSRLIGSAIEGGRFFYSFYFPYPIVDNFLTMLEEEMRRILKKRESFEFLTITPSNAVEYLSHLDRHFDFSFLDKERKNLITLLKFEDSFVDYVPSEMDNLEWPENIFFKLFDVIVLSKENFTIKVCGEYFSSKDELKQRVKLIKNYGKENHLFLGEKFSLWKNFGEDVEENEDNIIFLEKGIDIKNSLISFWKNSLKKRDDKDFFIFESFCTEILERESLLNRISLYEEIFKKTDKKNIAEVLLLKNSKRGSSNSGSHNGLLNMGVGTFPIESVAVLEKNLKAEIISYLHFIEKLLNMLGFRYSFVLSGGGTKKKNFWKDVFLEKEGFKGENNKESFFEFEENEENSFFSILKVVFQDKIGREWEGPFIVVLLDKDDFFYSGGSREPYVWMVVSVLGCIERFMALAVEYGVNLTKEIVKLENQ